MESRGGSWTQHLTSEALDDHKGPSEGNERMRYPSLGEELDGLGGVTATVGSKNSSGLRVTTKNHLERKSNI